MIDNKNRTFYKFLSIILIHYLYANSITKNSDISEALLIIINVFTLKFFYINEKFNIKSLKNFSTKKKHAYNSEAEK